MSSIESWALAPAGAVFLHHTYYDSSSHTQIYFFRAAILYQAPYILDYFLIPKSDDAVTQVSSSLISSDHNNLSYLSNAYNVIHRM